MCSQIRMTGSQTPRSIEMFVPEFVIVFRSDLCRKMKALRAWCLAKHVSFTDDGEYSWPDSIGTPGMFSLLSISRRSIFSLGCFLHYMP